MPDIADLAEVQIEMALRSSLYASTKKGGARLVPNHECHNCQAEVSGDRLFCAPLHEGSESECQIDYEHRVKRSNK